MMVTRQLIRVLVLTLALHGERVAAPRALWGQAASTDASAPTTTRYARAVHASRAVVDSIMVAAAVPGLSAAVLVRGEIVWSEGFGYADLENRAPVTPVTRFRVGSVSKSLTAAAIGLLVERGLLDIDAPVQRYVPDFPMKRWPITTRQLGGHLAGVRHYRGDEFLISRHYATVQEALTIFQGDSLMFSPGSAYSYSSYGWNLISAVVEGASGVDFLTFMRRDVFEPLGLRYTVAEYRDSLIPFRTRFYQRSDAGAILNAPYVDNSYKWAGGGFLSTPEDLVRFGDAMLRSTLLRTETVALLFTSQRTSDGKETGYGIGWRSGIDEAGRRWVGHSGGSVGGTAMLLLYPDTGVVVAVLANRSGAPSGAAARRIAEVFLSPS